MGFTSAWVISAHDDERIADFAPHVLPLLETERTDPVAQRRMRRWAEAPLPHRRTWYGPGGPDHEAVESFCRLTAAGPYDDLWYGDGFSVLEDVWEETSSEVRPFAAVESKDYAVTALFHALGPARAALLPGWCGAFLLTSREVRRTLPQVERAFAFTPRERAEAEELIWVDGPVDGESLLDGPPRCWRQAAAAGLGLCGIPLHVC